MAKLTPKQRQYIRKRTKHHDLDPSEMAGELNIIPFLDVVINLIMFMLVMIAAIAFFAQIQATLPDYRRGGVGRAGAQNEEALNLSVTVVENGLIVSGSGGTLAPGCESIASGSSQTLTVPKRGGEYDWEQLTACAVRIKAVPENSDERQVIIGADPLIPYGAVVRAMDAMRADGATQLFPEVLLSAGLRLR